MTRRLVRNAQTLSVVLMLIATYMIVFSPMSLAQVRNGSQAAVGSPMVSVSAPPNAPALQPYRVAGTGNNVEYVSVAAPPRSLSDNPMDSTPIVFLLFPSAFYSSGGSPDSVAVADVNGDGKPDLLVVNCDQNSCSSTGSIGVLLGNGDGTFQPAVTYDSGGYVALDVAVADVNGDGKPDLLVANCGTQFDCFGPGSVGVLLGNGDGTFQAAVPYDTVGGAAASIAVADVNGDGKPDLLVANTCINRACVNGGGVSVLLGNGDGTFQAAVAYYSSSGYSPAKSVAVADVNGDGKPDLLVVNCGDDLNCDGNGSVAVLLGNGDGTFQTVVTYDSGGASGSPNGSSARCVAVGDVNGDGKPDVVVANFASSTVGILRGNGDGTFQAAVTYSTATPMIFPPVGPFSVVLYDVNGDGKPDILVSADGAAYFLNNGDGTFGQPVFLDPSQGILSLAVADVNGDGKPDIAAVGYYAQVILNNNGAPPTTTSLVASVNPVTVKNTVTYTANIVPQTGGTTKGAVQFMDGFNLIGLVPLEGNQAALSVSYTFISTHAITAAYSGDLNHASGSFSNTVTETVRGTSRTMETTSGSPSIVGQSVTFTAKVTSKYGAVPDGELVTFADGRSALGSVALSGGTAAYSTSLLSGGVHVIKATYVGDATLAPSTGTVRQIVEKYATTIALSSSLNPSAYKQAVTFTATVSSAGPPPTGKIKFMDGKTQFGSAMMSGGVAAVTKSKLAVGSHSITAVYEGDGASEPSTSPVLDQVVNP